MSEWYYRYAGLQIASELELPEWESFLCSVESGGADVTIRIVHDSDRASPVAFCESMKSVDEYLFVAPDVGRYRISRGNEIVVFPMSGAGYNELRLFLLGSAWGILCYQRGLFAVHASAVQVGDEAVLFCGLQGKGKSTMTAWLAARGYGLVSDDLCCITLASDAKPIVYPSTQRLRLWRDTLAAFGWDSGNLERDHFRLDKYLLPWTERVMLDPLPIRSIYVLEWGELHLQRLNGLNALQKFVVAATYRGEALTEMGLSAAYWQRCLELLQTVPIWELQRQKEYSILDDLGRLLEEQWAPC